MTEESKEAILKVFHKGGDYVVFGEQLGYNKSTIYKAVKPPKSNSEETSKGRKPKLTPDEVKSVLEIVEEFPQYTLEELLFAMDQKGLPKVSQTTLIDPASRNTDKVKTERIGYINWFLQNPNKKLVYVDEFGCDLHTVRQGSPQAGIKQSVVAAISKELGLIYYDIVNGTEHDDWNSYVIIMDNAPIHTKDEVKRVLESVGIGYKFLPCYSPCLNPIEECFSAWKGKIRTILSTEKAAELMNSNTIAYGRRTQTRGNILRESIIKASDVVTVEKCANWANHVLTFFKG
ncbi:putative DDE superfamily endonuclease domain-containing protein 31 [Entamoeba marina]